MRMSRWQWLDKVLPLLRRGATPQTQRRAGRKPCRWFVDLAGAPPTVMARTKSEARARVKQHLGLRRLPAGTRITKEVLSRG